MENADMENSQTLSKSAFLVIIKNSNLVTY